MRPSWIIPDARIEHIALAEAGRVYVTRVLDVTDRGATIMDERNGVTAVVSFEILRRNYRPAPPVGMRERATTWWRSTKGQREAFAWVVRHPARVLELVQREMRRTRVQSAVTEMNESRKVN